jgi:hypothetical protein
MFKINIVLDLIGMIRLIFFQAVVDPVPIGSGLFDQLQFRTQGLPGLIRNKTGSDLFYLKFVYFSDSYFQVWSNSLFVFISLKSLNAFKGLASALLNTLTVGLVNCYLLHKSKVEWD